MPFDQRLNDGSGDEPDDEPNFRERICEVYMTEFMFLEEEEYDEAIIGITERAGMDSVIAYSQDKIIDILTRTMTLEDAIEHFYVNMAGSYMGEKTPIFIADLPPFV